jgi:hypothetical protein
MTYFRTRALQSKVSNNGIEVGCNSILSLGAYFVDCYNSKYACLQYKGWDLYVQGYS